MATGRCCSIRALERRRARFAFAGVLDARYKRFGLLVDGSYVRVESETGVTAHVAAGSIRALGP